MSIPEELENILWDISEKIPICIVSSKDFGFLHNKTKFASIVSCMLGIETLVLNRHERIITLSQRRSKEDVSNRIPKCHDFLCVKNSYSSIHDTTLQHNSELLSQMAEEIASNFNDVSIEHKFTSLPKKVLAGITIDWRHRDDWKSFKVRTTAKKNHKENSSSRIGLIIFKFRLMLHILSLIYMLQNVTKVWHMMLLSLKFQ